MTFEKERKPRFVRGLKEKGERAAGRLPAVPLITCDPYFSLWSGSDRLYEAETMHWTGREKRVTGTVNIDGTEYRFMGLGSAAPMKQTGLYVTATCTEYCFEAAGVGLTADFWMPLLLDDLDVLSRPCTYLDAEVRSLDGREHSVELVWEFSGSLCCDKGQTDKIGGGSYELGNKQIAWMGLREQSPLGHSGDGVTIDWGYLYLAADAAEQSGASAEGAEQSAAADAAERPAAAEGAEQSVAAAQGCKSVKVAYRQKEKSLAARFSFAVRGDERDGASLVAAYDDIASINYFGRMLPGYWAREGKTILTAISEAVTERGALLERCAAFEEGLEEKTGAFGNAYTKICAAAYRQSIAAHKLIADEKGEAVFISKECYSNGCAATVDVTYPSTPLFFCYNPELVRAMMRPVIRFAQMPVWGYDFAPHDAGRYPYVTGQVYGLNSYQRAAQDLRDGEEQGYIYPMLFQMPDSAQMYRFENQMPVEESGNLLILAAQLVRQDWENEKKCLEENLPLYEKWVKYLLEYGSDPGEQLCTDDFAGHLAHNVNLAIKAIMGVEGYSILMDAAGRKAEAAQYHEKAAAMAKDVYERAFDTDHTKLTFDGRTESWSLKYNAVWDLIFGSGLWDAEFYRAEIEQYRKMCNAYGVPLDSRESYTKSDWLMWASALDADKKAVEEFAERILKFLEESPDRVPFSDWYMTEDGRQRGFQNRTVQGGIFMPLLLA